MKIEDALMESKKVLDKKRYEHVERVTETAKVLAEKYNANQQQVMLAAALHDYAKNFSHENLKQWIVTHIDLPKNLLHYHHELWHGPVGAKIAESQFGIHDQEVLNAIRYHTTGRKGMTLVEKIVFIADYIEPGRDFPAVYQARELVQQHIDYACLYALKETISFLMEKKQSIHPDTFFAYNDLLNQCINQKMEVE